MNQIKTVALLGLLTALLLWMGQALGGSTGLAVAVVLAGAMNFGSYWWSDKIVLAVSGARPLTERDAPELHRAVRTLALKAGIPTPRLYRLPQAAPNAFATGRDPAHGAVAVTDGLLAALDRPEVEGVLAHEIGHIKNRDTLIMTVAAALGGALSILADMAMWAALAGRGSSDSEEGGHPMAGLLGVLVAPFAAMLIQTAISRSREFEADAAAARLSGNPRALASALRKIEALARRAPAAASPALAHLYIANPLRGGGLSALFSTHPTTRERVRRLEAMAVQGLSWAA